jgi:hypothetical protein
VSTFRDKRVCERQIGIEIRKKSAAISMAPRGAGTQTIDHVTAIRVVNEHEAYFSFLNLAFGRNKLTA